MTKKKRFYDSQAPVNRQTLNEAVDTILGTMEELFTGQKQILDTLENHTNTLKDHTNTLKSHTDILKNHTDILKDHTNTLKSHTDILKNHTDILKDHTNTLKSHTDILKNHTDRLDQIAGDVSDIKRQLSDIKVDTPTLSEHKSLEKRVIRLEDHAFAS